MKRLLFLCLCITIQISASINVPISFGELIDKITILEIKSERITDEKKLENVQYELNKLIVTLSYSITKDYETNKSFHSLRRKLKKINEIMWDIEDKVREKEAKNEFDEEFITLARNVYKTNDMRCAIKRQINLIFKSGMIEEKSYTKYD